MGTPNLLDRNTVFFLTLTLLTYALAFFLSPLSNLSSVNMTSSFFKPLENQSKEDTAFYRCPLGKKNGFKEKQEEEGE